MIRTLAVCALALATVPLYANPISVILGTSAQNYTLDGTGASNGVGTYLVRPGTCVPGAVDTICTLSGTYSGTTPGYTGGSYSLITSFANVDGGLPAVATSAVSVDGGNYFTMGPMFSSDVNMTLFLNGTTDVPLTVNGVFVADSLFVTDTGPLTCLGLPRGVTCTQGNVGLYAGASISSLVNETVNFESPAAITPEPQWLAFGAILPGALLLLHRSRRRQGTALSIS
jgi:hypothetical protein